MNDKIENIILDTIVKWNCITKNKCYENYHIIIKDNKIMAQGVKVKTSKPKSPAWALAMEERISNRIDNLDKQLNAKIDNLDKQINNKVDLIVKLNNLLTQ